MSAVIDYYLSLQSPWTYLGHQRLIDIARRRGARLRTYPVNMAMIFPATGGLPLAKRAPARQRYRLQELARWRDRLGLPLTLQPEYFPVDERAAAGMVVAQRSQTQGDDDAAATELAGSILRAVWAEQRNIADRATLIEIAGALDLDGERLLDAGAAMTDVVDADSRRALDAGVFGAPSYLIGDALFWGQDRLDFVDEALA